MFTKGYTRATAPSARNKKPLISMVGASLLCWPGVILASDPYNSNDDLRDKVKTAYATIAKEKKPCFSCNAGGCGQGMSAQEYGKALGYSEEELAEGAIGADLGLGCGNPGDIASLLPGEVVVDLGSGGGFDCFLAAKKVGDTGHIIGIDMTQEMLDLARKNAEKKGYRNVEFRLGVIENLPVENSSVDVIISNCVINLSTNKTAVFKEAARVLKPGGRLAISDVVTTSEIPEEIKKNVDLYTGCITGAMQIDKLASILEASGFEDIRIDIKKDSRSFLSKWAPGTNAEDFVASAYIYARKVV